MRNTRGRRRRGWAAGWFLLGAATALLLTRVFAAGAQEPEGPLAGTGVARATPVVSAAPAASPPPASPEEPVWNLALVNPWNPLPGELSVDLVELRNGQSVDRRCYPELQAMMDACRAEGLSPLICSSYRSWEKQETLFAGQVDKLVNRGLSRAEAEEQASRFVARPGTSEHQLGLAVDIVDLSNQNLDESQEDTPVQKWLMAHSWE